MRGIASILVYLALPLLAACQDWNVVTEVASGVPPGVRVATVGPRQQPFPRPPPRTLDPHLLDDFSDSFNLMQDISSTGDNMFNEVSEQYVASIPNAFVEGEGGLVYDAAGNVYELPYFFHNRTNPTLPLPQRSPEAAAAACTRRYGRLASVIQRYGHMYYHWLEETLPRVVWLRQAGALTPNTKILTWGQPYEAAWLQALGVGPEQVLTYDPEAVYCADLLLVPTPIPRVTPPREALVAVRSALQVATLPEAQRDLVVYVSREREPTRRVANEPNLLSAIQAAFPGRPLATFTGSMSPAETIALFQRARIVVGPHGAGLSHVLFSAPGTEVVEFLFMADPPMMFWHTAAALRQEYWLLPVPQAYYMQAEMQVPVGEVIDILTELLGPAAPPGACAAGTAGRAGGLCTACPPGSYAFNTGSAACKLCPPGQVAGAEGSTYCSTCKPGTYSSDDGASCAPCPPGTYSVLPGAGSPGQCSPPEDRRRKLVEQSLSVDMLTKLSPVFAKQIKRRALIQGVTATEAAAAMSQQELCTVASAAGAMGDPYRGPYLLNGTSTLCPPTTGVMPAPAPYGQPVVPPPVVLPPIDVGTPQPEPAPAPSPPVDNGGNNTGKGNPLPPPAPPRKNKVLDGWAIALIATAGALIVIPLLFCCGRWCVVRRRRSKQARAAAAASAVAAVAAAAPLGSPTEAADSRAGRGKVGRKASNGKRTQGDKYSTSNPLYSVDASTTSGAGGGSRSGP